MNDVQYRWYRYLLKLCACDIDKYLRLSLYPEPIKGTAPYRYTLQDTNYAYVYFRYAQYGTIYPNLTPPLPSLTSTPQPR